MNNCEVLEKYYEYANAGKWMDWCDLFAENQEMDEQLAGHISGLKTLREMMTGMGKAYARFQNVPRYTVLDGDQGAVLSHISARAAKYPGEAIEADVMNYFKLANGKIAYMENCHDSKPFAPFLRQLAGG